MSVIGVTFLVHGKCKCGWWMAAPEGARWPKCPECSKQVLPPDERDLRLGYVAEIMPEQEALAVVPERRRLIRETKP